MTLPVAGTISTYTPLLGIQGVIGVKSGYTTAAGGCDVIAVDPSPCTASRSSSWPRSPGNREPRLLAQAGLHGLALVDALGPLIGTTQVLRGGAVAARVHEAGRTVGADDGLGGDDADVARGHGASGVPMPSARSPTRRGGARWRAPRW